MSPPPRPEPSVAEALQVIARVLATALKPMIESAVRDVFVEFHQAEPPKRILVDARELGTALAVSRATVYRLVEEGMPYVLVGDTRKFDTERVLAWLEAHTAERSRGER